MANLKQCNIVVSILTAAIGAAIATSSYGYGIAMTMFGPAAGFWPFILGLCLIVVAICIAFDTFRHAKQLQVQTVELTAPHNVHAYKMMALVSAFILLVFIIGFYVATALFLGLAFYLLGVRNKKLLVAIILLFLAFLYVIFQRLLHIQFPLPIFMD